MTLFGCQAPAEVRYRVSLNIDERGAVRAGSSVWSWTLTRAQMALASPYNGKFKGEAVRVQLSDGRVLFAVLRGAGGNENAPPLLPERIFGDVGRDSRGEPTRFGGDRLKDIRDIASRVGEERTVNCATRPDDCLMLVTFRDLTDPSSIAVVDPQNPHLTLGKQIGRITMSVEITDAPVTTGSAGILPEPQHNGFFNWDGKSPFDQRTAIALWDFRKGTDASGA